MNPKVQLENLKKDLEWMFLQAISTKQTINVAFAVSEIFDKTNALSTFGDYFAYSQNIMIGEVQLQLSKMYIKNIDSITLPKIIELSNDLFTEKYYQDTRKHNFRSYIDLKSKLEELSVKLNELSDPIKNLKIIRDKNLAHFDKEIKNYDDLEAMNQTNPVFLNRQCN